MNYMTDEELDHVWARTEIQEEDFFHNIKFVCETDPYCFRFIHDYKFTSRDGRRVINDKHLRVFV